MDHKLTYVSYMKMRCPMKDVFMVPWHVCDIITVATGRSAATNIHVDVNEVA